MLYLGITLYLIVSLLPLQAYCGDTWSRSDTVLEITWQVIHGIDWIQTRQVAQEPDKYYEFNPVLGRHPSENTVNLWFLVGAVLHPIVTEILPSRYRPYWQSITIGLSSACVINNFNVGIGIKF